MLYETLQSKSTKKRNEFVEHFHDQYGNQKDSFLEEEGRRYFLLYLWPIINGTETIMWKRVPAVLEEPTLLWTIGEISLLWKQRSGGGMNITPAESIR